MKIHAILMMKNEADIIRRSLSAALDWADWVYVLDNGSIDESWDIVCSMAGSDSRIEPFRQDNRKFNNGMRADVFNAYKDRASEGDWWVRLDADEFYIDPPKRFLSKIPQCHHVVWAVHFQYYFTHADYGRYLLSPFSLEDLHFYLADSSEPRFFRHRKRLKWDSGACPKHMGLVAPERIRLRHYQYRSPDQIRLRLATRLGQEDFPHVPSDAVTSVLRDENILNDDRDGLFYSESDLPRHIESPHRRWVKRLMHGLKMWP